MKLLVSLIIQSEPIYLSVMQMETQFIWKKFQICLTYEERLLLYQNQNLNKQNLDFHFHL